MDKPSQKILDYLIRTDLLKHVDRIYLFGSRARGDANARSDIDLAFDCPALTDREWLAVLDVLDDAPSLLKIDAVRYNTTSRKLQQRIKQEGIILYEQGKGLSKHGQS